jgi:hypothetical protein
MLTVATILFKFFGIKQTPLAGLMAVILATWEAEIRRIVVLDQPGKQLMRPHSQKNQGKVNCRCGSSNRVPALQT